MALKIQYGPFESKDIGGERFESGSQNMSTRRMTVTKSDIFGSFNCPKVSHEKTEGASNANKVSSLTPKHFTDGALPLGLCLHISGVFYRISEKIKIVKS